MAGHPDIQNLRTSPDGIELIKEFESFFPDAYLDPVNVWTIGWGHTESVSEGDHITRDEGEVLLQGDLIETEGYIKNIIKVPLTQHQFDALVSICFNMGIGNLQKKTEIVKLTNRGNYAAACADFGYHFSGTDRNTNESKEFDGLKRRRAAEMALWNLPDHVASDKSPISPPLQKGEGGITPDKPKNASDSPLKDMVEQSTTVKLLLGVLTSLVTLVAQLLEPLKKNPSAAIVIGIAMAGVLGTLAWKYKDVKKRGV